MVNLRILGSTELRREDGELEHSFLRGPKRLGILAYLVLARPRGYHRRDFLLPLFWPEHGQRGARNALSNMLYHIRRVLGNDVLTSRGTEEIGVRMEKLWCDALAFEDALAQNQPKKALKLYRGDLLKAFHIPDAAPEFEHWLNAERERLRMQATEAAWTVSDQEMDAGNWVAAKGWAKKAAAFTPFSETAHMRLITLLDRTGSRTGALEVYEDFAARLREEWGLEPSPSMTALSEEISTRPPSPPATIELRQGRTAIDQSLTAKGVDDPSIAVLPFSNFSPDPQDEYLSDGIAEEIIHRLVKIRTLHVAARVSSFAFKGKNVDIHEIGEKLRVSYVLEGSMRKSGEQLRVTAQLIDVASGYHLWSETYQRKLEDVFTIQDEISRMIVEALRIELNVSADQVVAPVPRSTTAYDLYLKGRYFFNKRTKDALQQAVTCFEQAIAHDPAYARAYSGLADTYLVLGSSSFELLSPHESLDCAREKAEQALELGDELAEAHVSLGMVRMREYDWQRAREHFEHAIVLDPGYAEAHQRYGWFLALQGDFERGLQTMCRAEELDPLSLPIKTAIGRIYHFMRRPEDAINQFRSVLDIDPGYDGAYIGLGLAYLYKQCYSEAIACFERANDAYMCIPPGILAFAFALAGQHKKARGLLDDMRKETDEQHVSPILIGWIHMGLGEKDVALDYFEEAYRRASPASAIKVEPLLDPVRSHRRFKRLLRKVGLDGTTSVRQPAT